MHGRPGQIWSLVVLMPLVLFLRRPEAFLNPQFWAEDSRIFYCHALDKGARAVVMGYAGYHHLIPRLIAWCSLAVDPVYAPAVFVYSAVAITVVVGVLMLSARLPLPGKWALALAIVLVPNAGEVFQNPTNLQWILALALLATTLKQDPVRVADWVTDGAVLLLAGLTGPFALLIVPLAVLRWAVRRSWQSFIILGLTLATSACHLVEYLHFTPYPQAPGPVDFRQTLAFLSLHLPLELFGAQGWGRYVGQTPCLVAGLVAVAAWAWFAGDPRKPEGLARWTMLIFALLVVGAALFRVRFDRIGFDDFLSADRYMYISRTLLWWVLILAAGWSTARARTATVLLVIGFILCAPYLRFHPWIDYHWRNYTDQIRAGEEVMAHCNPDWDIYFAPRKVERDRSITK